MNYYLEFEFVNIIIWATEKREVQNMYPTYPGRSDVIIA